MEFSPLGDSAVLIRFGDRIELSTHRRIVAFSTHLAREPFAGMIEQVPAYTTLAVHYDPTVLPAAAGKTAYDRVCEQLRQRMALVPAELPDSSRLIEIPVCYGEDFGPDLPFVADHAGLSPADVIRMHAEATYQVYLIGFSPGFPYLGDLPEQIRAPRKATPRIAVPAGSVGIAGAQTGIYPMESPGGWQLIGRTPVELFHPDRSPPTLLHLGDRVRFHSIMRSEYVELGAAPSPA